MTSRPLAYPTRNICFQFYVMGWWVQVRSDARLGRVIDIKTIRHPRATQYLVWIPAQNRSEWFTTRELQSATQMQSQAASLHPLADQETPADTGT